MAHRMGEWWLGLGLLLGAPLDADASAVTKPDEADAYRMMYRLAATSPEPRQRLFASFGLADRSDARTSVARDVDQAEARALFASVRVGSTDPWVLWMTATSCPFDAALCDRDGALRQLTQLQPDNAAPWSLALGRAVENNDAAGVDEALARMAGSTVWVDHYLETGRVALAAFEALAASPQGYRFLAPMINADPAAPMEHVEVAVAVGTVGIALAIAIPGLNSIVETCKDEALNAHARRADCRAVARHLMTANTTVGQRVGAGLARRLAVDAAERAEIDSLTRRLDWQLEAQSMAFLHLDNHDGREPTDADLRLVRAWTAAWRTATSESEVTAAVLKAAGMPVDPPASYRSPERPESIDD